MKKILIPIDFSEQSLIAMGQSYNLVKHLNARVVLLYIIEEPSVVGAKIFRKTSVSKASIEKKLNKLAAEVKEKVGKEVNILVAKGAVPGKIVEIAELIKATYILMGANSATGLKKKLIGSNALRVVRESPVPVITIKGKDHRDGCSTIVLPLDLTKETAQKVKNALALAKLGNGADIKVLSVLLTVEDSVVKKMTKQMEEVRKTIEGEGVSCTAEIVKAFKGEESLGRVIIDYSNRVQGDLIMIMTQQENEIKDYFIGSAAKEIINDSDIPVLSIIPKKIKLQPRK